MSFQKLICKYQKIIIQRHCNPDFDAYGAQMGLRNILVENFPNKEIYVVGDEMYNPIFGVMDEVEESYAHNALVIILDVSVAKLISMQHYKHASDVVIIDHHNNIPDIEYSLLISKTNHIATCEIVGELMRDLDYVVSVDSASCLFSGLVTDSGRFMYKNTSAATFSLVDSYIDLGIDFFSIYIKIYQEKKESKKLKGYALHNFNTKDEVAYLVNEKNVKEKYGVSEFEVSRGLVNQMAGIKGITAWVNFTITDDDNVLCEIRGASYPVLPVARKYGGGGHKLACGCSLNSTDEISNLLEDLLKLSRGEEV